MKVLMFGGTGFIGSRLGKELIAREHEIVALGRKHGDVSVEGVADALVGQYEPDLAIHLAAQPGRVFGEEHPSWTVQDNTISTIHIAQACARTDVRLCYISTSEVYGDIGMFSPFLRAPLSLQEVHAGQGNFLNLYALTKWAGELASKLYAPKDLLIIRPSMTYGPGMATGYGRAALPTMIDNFLHGESYTVHADTARSWCYADDLVRGMVDVIERGEGTYNVGRDDDLRYMVSIAHLVCSVLHADPSLIKIGEPDATIRPIKDISMARLRSLGWEPRIDIVEGIKLTADSLQ
jgi:nucleoside-diphosphate-sugar epimerase